MIEKIKVGWKTYDIEVIKPCSAKLNVVSQKCYGEINYDERKIYLSNEYSEEQQKVTFIHELLHAISDMYGIDNLDENTVTKTANALYIVLKDNEL